MYFSYFVCLHHYMHYAFCIVSLCNNDARHLSLEYSEDSFGFHHEVRLKMDLNSSLYLSYKLS